MKWKNINTMEDLKVAMKDEGIKEEPHDFLSNNEMSMCDKCECIESTYNLVWITAEDFEPKENEVIPEGLYAKYDSLCEECYQECIKK